MTVQEHVGELGKLDCRVVGQVVSQASFMVKLSFTPRLTDLNSVYRSGGEVGAGYCDRVLQPWECAK